MAIALPLKPSPRNCAVPNCINRYSGNGENRESYPLFKVSSNSLHVWQELVPNVKLHKTSKLCNRHFDDSDILKGYNILGVFHPFKSWRLRVGSNPKHHLGMASSKCYVMGCKSGHATCKEAILFFTPKDLKTVNLWDEFIGHEDVKLNMNHLVCHKHFQDKDIIKTIVKEAGQNKDGQTPRKIHVRLAVGAVPKLLTGKSPKMVETPRPPLPEVKGTPQCSLPQPLILRKVSKENVIKCKDPAIKPILIDKSVCSVKNNDGQTLQNVSPAAQKITNHQPAPINSLNAILAINQQFPPVGFLIQKVQNTTAQEFRNVSSTTQPSIVNPKDATLPSSWFWQEGSLKEQEFICSKFKWLDENKFEYTKSVVIDRDTRTLRFFVRGEQVFHLKLKYQFSTVNELIDCFRFYDKIPECAGYSDSKSLEISASCNLQAKSSDCETRSKNCLLLADLTKGNSCRNCVKKDNNIRKDTHPKKNVLEQISNGSKTICNVQPIPEAISESPAAHLNLNENLDENIDELQVSRVFLDHSYGSMTSQPVLDKSSIKTGKESKNDENGENDISDLDLAKRFLHNERTRKKLLWKKLSRELKILEKSKDIARAILKGWKKLQKKMKEKPKRPKAPLTPCNLCGRMVLVSRMNLHLKIHGGYKPHSCDLCGRAFANRSSLKSHVRFNHLGMPKPYMCSTCGKTFRNKTTMVLHEITHTNEKPFECSICDKRYRSRGGLKIHKRSHTGEKPYTCKFCGISYAHSKTLKRHLHRHHENLGPDGKIDPTIGYVWKKKGGKRNDTGGKRHPCTICEKTYSDKKDLKKHVQRYHEPGESDSGFDPITRTRTRTRIEIPCYRCEFCQKEFCRVLAFERHRSTHTGKAVAVPCSQPNCDFTYSCLKELKDHLVASHPAKGFTCDTCGKIFLAELNLVLHQAAHDASLGFQCSYCPLRSITMSGLRKHEKIHTRDKSNKDD